MAIRFTVPGTTAPEITVQRRPFLVPKVLVDGVPLARRRWPERSAYDLPMPDGSVEDLRVKGNLRGLHATVDGVDVPLAPRLSVLDAAMIFAPAILFVVGVIVAISMGRTHGVVSGAVAVVLAGALGGGSVSVALSLSHRPIRPLVRRVTIIVLAVACGGIGWLSQVPPAPIAVFEAGTCLDVAKGGTLTASTVPVSCATGHMSEVIGTVDLSGEAAFPGDTALRQTASTQCRSLFTSYVGGDPTASSLATVYFVPTEKLWGSGNRHITCLVYTRDGSQLTGSVRGTSK